MTVIEIVSDFKKNNSMIWVENDSIKLFVSDNFKNQNLKNTIVKFKSELFDLLVYNSVFSKNDFKNKNIFKVLSQEVALSFAQERLWFIEQYEGGTNAYHVPEIYELGVDTDKEGIKYALQQIVSRHEVLRSTIEQGEADEHGIQVVHDDALLIEEIKIKETDDYESMMREEINRPFNLGKEYPIRVKFYTIESSLDNSESRTLLLINTHHIANDGWSEDIFQKELLTYYEAYINNDKSFSLAPLEIQYKDYSLWQRSYLTGETLDKQLSYWKNKLSGYQTLEFPTDYARPSKIDYRGASQSFSIGKEVSQKLRALAQKNGVTLHSVMLSSISILLSKYTGQNDIVTGSPIANRHHRQTEDLIGFFINNQVNRTLLSNAQSFEELIREVHQEQIEAQSHQDLPFEKLVDQLKVERDISRHPIFQILFVVQSYGSQDKVIGNQKAYLTPYHIEGEHEIEKLNLSIYINDSTEELMVNMSYATSLFRKETISRFADHYTHLLNQLVEASSKPYSQISLLNDKEYDRIIYEWNATDKNYPSDKTIVDLFEEQVVKAPGNIAIEFEGKQLTYQELNEESNKIANYLTTNYDIQTNDLIGIMLDRSEKMIISILGILKAGAAYVCIDPVYPFARKKHIIEDASLKVLITQADFIFDFDFYKGNIFAIDVQLDSIENSAQPSKRSIKPDDLAYVIYTSGTTGNPKGVMVEHRGLVNLVQNQINYFNIKNDDNVIQFASYVFDASLSEIFTTLTIGAKLSIVPNVIRKDVYLLSEYLEKHQINIATLPPAILSALPYKEFTFLKTLIVAGESCPLNLLVKWSRGRKLINAYGPTEVTVCATMHKYDEGDLNTNIGKSLQNVRLYILDMNRAPVPIGVIGELYIGGAGLARGYLNRAELTSERFIKNPFATDTDKQKGYDRLYKTGDLVRWLPDGNIEYIGRNDDQVKIRGYRIELGEIESALSQIGGIKQSCVLVKEKQTDTGINKYLVGYYVLDNDSGALDQTLIQEKLSQSLPEYMIPSALVMMESFPLTINGKLDKKALPDPEFSSEDNYVAPNTEIEKTICGIWQNVLGLEKIGVTDDFFKLGGNSILAIQVSHSMSKVLGYNVKVAELFKYKTINSMLDNINVADVDVENLEKEF